MILVDRDVYDETLEILRGNKNLPDIYSELKDWLKKTYKITAYNFVFQEIKYNNPTHRFELYILLSSESDYDAMFISHKEFKHYTYNKDRQSQIANKLCELAKKYNSKNIHIYEDVWICYNNFSKEMKSDFNECACQNIGKRLSEKFNKDAVWEIHALFGSAYVFYYRDADIKLNSENGVSKQIKDKYYQELHKLDEFSVFTYDSFNMVFDSKENVDQNYGGSLFYYFK